MLWTIWGEDAQAATLREEPEPRVRSVPAVTLGNATGWLGRS